MAYIRTVRGDIAPETLGFTLMHEHLLTDPPASIADTDFRMDSEAAAGREVGYFKMAGGETIVEMTPRDYGRQPEGLRRVSEASRVHIVAVTGWIKEKVSRPYIENRTVDDLAAEMIADITEGFAGSSVQAGIIKAGSSLNAITPLEEKVFRAAARAHHATGAAISTHTEEGTMGLEQAQLLIAEGVPPEKILIGHMDRRLDEAYHRAVAETGVTLGYDQIGKEKYYPDSLRIQYIKTMLAAGYGAQLALSGDMARRSNWPSYGGGPGLTFMLWRFIPWLKSEDVPDASIRQIFWDTPRRLLTLHR